MKLELFYPIKNPFIITQKFGQNLNPIYKELKMAGHNGWDIVGQTGQIIRAAHDGIVTFTGEDGSGGLGVVIRTLDQREYNDGSAYFKTIYWHCFPGSFLVKAGDIVKCGQPVAKCDTTGAATGAHLHFGLKPMRQGEQDWQWFNLEQDNGYNGAIDPFSYWSGMYAEDYRSFSDQLALIAKKVAELWKIVFNK